MWSNAITIDELIRLLLRRIGKEEKEVSNFGSPPVRVYFEMPIFRTANLIIFALLPESVDYKMGMIGGAEKRRKRRRGGGSEVKVRGVANAGTGVPASQGARPGVSSSSALCSTSPSVTCTFSSHFHSPCKKRL